MRVINIKNKIIALAEVMVLPALVLLFGCSPYRSSFDCSLAHNKATCQRVSKIAEDVERDIKSEGQNDNRISYVRV